jgi:hypothetical protein
MTSAFVLGGINGFRAYYLLKTGDGATSISVFDDPRARRSPIAQQHRGSPRLCPT